MFASYPHAPHASPLRTESFDLLSTELPEPVVIVALMPGCRADAVLEVRATASRILWTRRVEGFVLDELPVAASQMAAALAAEDWCLTALAYDALVTDVVGCFLGTDYTLTTCDPVLGKRYYHLFEPGTAPPNAPPDLHRHPMPGTTSEKHG